MSLDTLSGLWYKFGMSHKADHDKIRKLLADGVPQTEVARTFGVSKSYVWKVAHPEYAPKQKEANRRFQRTYRRRGSCTTCGTSCDIKSKVCWGCYMKAVKNPDKRPAKPTIHTSMPRVPVAPFARVWREYMNRYGLNMHEFAKRAGFGQETLRGIVNRGRVETISFDFADTVMCRLGLVLEWQTNPELHKILWDADLS